MLAEFLRALHDDAPAGAPANPSRGIPLAELHRADDDLFAGIANYPGVDRARQVWTEALAAPPWKTPPPWLHADLHPANVVVRDGMRAGAIDFGEMCAGDPATDLCAA